MNRVIVEAKVLDIYTDKMGIKKVKQLDSNQRKLYEKGSKAIRKVGTDLYVDYTDAYTVTFLKVQVRETPLMCAKIDIRNMLKELTGRKKFTQKFYKELKSKLPKKIKIEIDKDNRKIYFVGIKEVLANAVLDMII